MRQAAAETEESIHCPLGLLTRTAATEHDNCCSVGTTESMGSSMAAWSTTTAMTAMEGVSMPSRTAAAAGWASAH